jgi:DNA-binding FadR family transcriptional regulator
VADGPDRFLPRPRVGLSEAVADQLRSRILAGAHHDGDLLPKQEELMEEFGVSKPALREALRILETEGLLEVRRGNVGGAVVRIPQPEGAAYTLGLVLQARQVPFTEIGVAVQQLEPVCAGLCAARPDRKRTVVPALRSSQRDLRQAIKRDDADAVLRASRGFHETLVTQCGSETLIVLVGTLEALWTAQARAIGDSAAAAGHRHDPAFRVQTIEAHEELLRDIDDGDIDLATKSARIHLQNARLHAQALPLDQTVHAATVRDHYFRTSYSKNGSSK